MFLHRDALLLVLVATLCYVPVKASTATAASDELRAATKCRRVLTAKGRSYAALRRRLLQVCAKKLLKCELKFELDGDNPGTCRSRAEDGCKRSLQDVPDSRLNKVAARFDQTATASCEDAGIAALLSTVAGGLWFGNDLACGASADVPTLIPCLRGELEAFVDESVGRMEPRAGVLLDNAGLGAGFPDLPRPPTTDVVVDATAPDSGDIVNPGTIVSPTGNAIRFTGDPDLSCGGGKNGKLTVRLTADPNDPCNDPDAYELQIKEPYGTDASATFGPFVGDLNYCLKLKDSQCDDEETGVVDVQ